MWEVWICKQVCCGCESKEDALAVARMLCRHGVGFVTVRFNESGRF